MPFRNFNLLGEELIEEWANRSPFRMNRLITALEDFVCGGPATRIAPTDAVVANVEVYLAPPRPILKSVPDSAAVLLVDRQARTVAIIEVIDDYIETDEQVWLDLLARAERALESHG